MNKRNYTPSRPTMKFKSAMAGLIVCICICGSTVQGLALSDLILAAKLALWGHTHDATVIFQQFLFAVGSAAGAFFFATRIMAANLVSLNAAQRDNLLREVEDVTKGHLAKNKERELLNLADEKREKKTRAAIYRTAPKSSAKPWSRSKKPAPQESHNENPFGGYSANLSDMNASGDYSLSINLD